MYLITNESPWHRLHVPEWNMVLSPGTFLCYYHTVLIYRLQVLSRILTRILFCRVFVVPGSLVLDDSHGALGQILLDAVHHLLRGIHLG